MCHIYQHKLQQINTNSLHIQSTYTYVHVIRDRNIRPSHTLLESYRKCVSLPLSPVHTVFAVQIILRELTLLRKFALYERLNSMSGKWTNFYFLRYHSKSTVNSSGFNLSFSANVEVTRLHSDQYDIG